MYNKKKMFFILHIEKDWTPEQLFTYSEERKINKIENVETETTLSLWQLDHKKIETKRKEKKEKKK